MKTFSIRNRMLYGIWGLLLVAVVPPLVYLSSALRRDFMEEAARDARSQLRATAWLLADRPEFPSEDALDAWLKAYADLSGYRISYIAGGRVAADSEVAYDALDDLDDHTVRPELKEARETGFGMHQRRSLSLDREMLYVAMPVDGLFNAAPGILRLAVPVSELQARFEASRTTMLAVLGVCFALSGLLSFLAMRPFVRNLDSLARAARALGQGHYGRRIRYVPWKELQPLAGALNSMAASITGHMEELAGRGEKLEALVNSIHDGVVLLDGHGRIESGNSAASRMFPSVPAPGRSLLEVSLSPELQQAADGIRQGKQERAETVIRMGEERIYAVRLQALRHSKGGVVAVFHDISEQQRLERMRRDFVANVSHELKTPLCSIKGYAETLLDMPMPENQQQRSFLDIILRNADHMTQMVNSLLTLARAEYAGETPGAAEPVDVADLVREEVEAFRPRAEARGISLETDLQAGVLVLAEKGGVREVVRNLLDNAIKYAPTGGQAVAGAAESDGRGVFWVQDNGPAIPEQDRERIFERFYRAGQGVSGSGANAKNGSAGLGLAICRRIVRSFEGDIRLETPVDRTTGTGVAFYVELPGAG